MRNLMWRKFNVKFKDKRMVDRTMMGKTVTEIWDYMQKKYPKQVILEVKEVSGESERKK